MRSSSLLAATTKQYRYGASLRLQPVYVTPRRSRCIRCHGLPLAGTSLPGAKIPPSRYGTPPTAILFCSIPVTPTLYSALCGPLMEPTSLQEAVMTRYRYGTRPPEATPTPIQDILASCGPSHGLPTVSLSPPPVLIIPSASGKQADTPGL